MERQVVMEKLRALVVDDEINILELIKYNLEFGE